MFTLQISLPLFSELMVVNHSLQVQEKKRETRPGSGHAYSG